MRNVPGIHVGKVNGYGDCWYCNETVVDPRKYRIETTDGPLTIAVCRKHKCREAAEDGAMAREDM